MNKRKLKFEKSFLKWFLEIFTKKYYQRHSISVVIFCSIIVIVIYSSIFNLIPNFNMIYLWIFLLKLLVVFYVFISIKFISEKVDVNKIFRN